MCDEVRHEAPTLECPRAYVPGDEAGGAAVGTSTWWGDGVVRVGVQMRARVEIASMHGGHGFNMGAVRSIGLRND